MILTAVLLREKGTVHKELRESRCGMQPLSQQECLGSLFWQSASFLPAGRIVLIRGVVLAQSEREERGLEAW